MITQLARYTRHMILLTIVGILLILVSQAGSDSGGFLVTGILAVVVGVGLLVLTIVGGRRKSRQ
ncbi:MULTISPECIES: hypothetical protein [unclassified Oerskovia]|uniref:hypothetical protein n=1 Tax=unclassified Oerskovia TaxID=2619021 RepID=UPI000B302A82|nr:MULTISPECIES: hypothetical protein [unclassified Oerskovia]